jgi:long-chain acyl-CoA synthetase
MMRGYWRDPEATREAFADGWFRTGDVGYRDADGYLHLVDRTKDVIMRGGYSVYPREVEDALYEHPAVSEAAVVGVPDDLLGEEVVAVVVPRAGNDCDPAAIRAFVRERVAAYKYPRLVVVAAELPHGPSGKILKREIDRGPLRAALNAESKG